MHKKVKEELRVRFIVTVLKYENIFGVTKSKCISIPVENPLYTLIF